MSKKKANHQKTATDYLIQWKTKQEGWLQKLTDKILVDKRVPEQSFLEEVYEDFYIENSLKKATKGAPGDGTKNQKSSKTQSQSQKTSPSVLKLLSLTHVKGVNALKEGESLSFNPKLTVVFGHNGTGKSGYTRILKRVSGSATSENIWSDVHTTKKVQNQCEAKISFEADSKQKEIVWKGEPKVFPFTQISVFDGKSVPIYLNQRLEFAYNPYEFELFSKLSESILKLRGKLEEEIERKESLVNFSNLFHPGTKIYEFAQKIGAETKISEVSFLAQWTANDGKLLKQTLEEQKQLMGIEKQITIEQQGYEKLSDLTELIEEILFVLSPKKVGLYLKAISNYLQLKKTASQQTKSDLSGFEVENAQSIEWKTFIESAEEYIKTLKQHKHYPTEKNKCIYCQQTLSKEAVKLITIYRKVTGSEEENKLKEAEKKRDELVEEIETAFKSEYLFQQLTSLQKLLGKRLLSDVESFQLKVNDLKSKNILALETGNKKLIKSCSPNSLVKKLRNKLTKLKNELDNLTETEKSQERKLKQINEIIQNLIDKKKLAKNKKDISQYIKNEKWKHKAEQLLNKLDTKPITDLGKVAWRSLVSNAFEEAFRKERYNLSAPEVEMSFPAEYGIQKREKFFEGLRNIDEFLSEGEQRAVALADFLAELDVSNGATPVVFDDPVNSFDKDRKESLAKRIFKLSENRQVIVFTHDVIFSSYLFDFVSDEDNRKLKSDIASFHWLERTNGKSGEVVENDYPRTDKLNPTIAKAERILGEIKRTKGSERREKTEQGYSYLRKALECFVLEKLFAKVVKKWDERIHMHNLDKVETEKKKYQAVRSLFGQFSRYEPGHQHSEEVYANFPSPSQFTEDLKTVKSICFE